MTITDRKSFITIIMNYKKVNYLYFHQNTYLNTMKGNFVKIQLLLIIFTIVLNACKNNLSQLPTLTTTELSAIDVTNAVSGGDITDDGNANIMARGVCWSTSPLPTLDNSYTSNGEGIGNFVSRLTDLNNATKYYVRAYATNSEGTAYGNELSFTTSATFVCGNDISDYDGNIYSTISIGNQCWIKENLTTSYYNDGQAIPTELSNTAWITTTTGAFADYGNNPTLNATYGKLYNWHAVNTTKLCPKGWHIPTNEEWNELTTFLGGESEAGGKMKALTNWQAPNTGATNSSGFSGLPGGYRFDIRISPNVGLYGNYWSATAIDDYAALSINLGYSNANVGKTGLGMVNGLSCRCIKD